MFAKVPGMETEFTVNDLVRETAELAQTELR